MLSWFANLRLRYKVLVAPGMMIVVLIGVGACALSGNSANQAAVDKLMTGPIRQAETVAEFTNAAWTSQVHLYRLMATAANETDPKKIAALSGTTAKSLAEMTTKLKAFEDATSSGGKNDKDMANLKAAVAQYIKQSKNVIDMADGDAGTALTLMMGATRSFATIENLADSLSESSKESRDRQMALNNKRLGDQNLLLIAILVIAVGAGLLVSLFVGRGITKPIVDLVPELRKLADGDFNISLSARGRKDEIGQILAAIDMVVEKVGSTIGDIKVSASEVSSASAEISTSTTDLSQRT